MTLDIYIISAMLGLIIGSFLNVCIYRLPRGLSIVWPSSRCPKCSAPIKPWDNIPVLSFLILLGRCRSCKARISPRYPIVEAVNGIIYPVLLWRYGLGWHIPFLFAFASSLVVITLVDLDFFIIPDEISIPGIPLGAAAGALFLTDPFMRVAKMGPGSAVIGAAGGFLLFYLTRVLSRMIYGREGMGGGDVKLMGMVGGVLGWKGVLSTTFLGSLVGSVFGIYMIIMKGKGRTTPIPFGPFLAAGALLSLLMGQEMLGLYLRWQT